ncbi:MAG: adenylate/guanylate cyclase domain-containing protein [Actinomycetota bacterium]|nr:adenylate/guanylate cyclase domain-containing protein [Actinomycetota bacterium]
MSETPGGPSADAREAALARVRGTLAELGVPRAEIDQAVADGVIDLLVVDRMLMPADRSLTGDDVAARAGVPVELVRRLWRALGFPDTAPGERAFTEMDVDAVRLFSALVALGAVDEEAGIQMARVIGSSMARIADAEVAPGTTPVTVSSGDPAVDADAFVRTASSTLPAMARLLEFVWRRHVQAATRRAMLLRARTGSAVANPVMAVGFADMVGFTSLSQKMSEVDLAALIGHAEEVAHDTITRLGGRVVKMIGDEAMFVAPSATDAAGVGLALAIAYADDDLLSDVRVGLASGAVLVQDGDYYGPVVNLASRIVTVARPGTVLVSPDFRAALGEQAADRFTTKPLRPLPLKGIGRVALWRLYPADVDRPPRERPRPPLRSGRAERDRPQPSSSRNVAIPPPRRVKEPEKG